MPGYMYIPAGARICRNNRDTCYDMPAYIRICRPNIFDILCRRRDAGLPDLHGSLVRHIGPGYGQRSYPGYISQLRCHVPTIKEENIQAWSEIMVAGCTVEVTYPHCAQVQAYLRMVRSQSWKYKVQGYEVPSRAIREEVKGRCLRQQVLFGV